MRAPLEHFDRWDIHKEGTGPAVRRVTDALDGERIAVREALGYGAPHFPLADHYASAGAEWMYGRGSHGRLTDSGDWREHIVLTAHRYMLEDIGVTACRSLYRARSAPVSLLHWRGPSWQSVRRFAARTFGERDAHLQI